jgi:O-antigen ligase
MMQENTKFYNLNIRLTYYSLLVLSIGLFTSISISAASHILIFMPAMYFAYRHFKKEETPKLTKSQWALLGVCATIVLSVLINFPIVDRPFKYMFKVKYFLLPLLGVFAYKEAFKSYIDTDKKKLLLNLLLISTSVATISGLISLKIGFNPISQIPERWGGRASGLFGHTNTYAYGLSLFMIILTGLVVYRDKLKQLVSTKWLIIHFAINIVGLYFTYARGAWLGYLFAVPFFFWSNKKIFFFIAGLSLLALISAILLSNKVNNRFLYSQSSDNGRIAFYKTAYRSFLERPIKGLGYKNLEPNMNRIKKKYNIEFPDHVGDAHNNLVEHLATTGIIGFLFLLLFHIFWFQEAITSGLWLGKIMSVFVISFTISGMVDYTFGDGENLFLIMGFYALSITYLFAKKALEEQPEMEEVFST